MPDTQTPGATSRHPAVEFVGVHKWYGQFHVLRNVSLRVRTGERVVICGPSGSGKSTLIRCVNRLEEHQRGVVRVHGVELNDGLKHADRVRRDVGMVFQQFNLFPHLTALENCTLAPVLGGQLGPARGRGAGARIAREGQDRGSGAQISGPAFRGPAAARRDRARFVHESESDAL